MEDASTEKKGNETQRKNPTPNSNYLFDDNDSVMFGWYPSDKKGETELTSNMGVDIMTTGRNVFVSLCTSSERTRASPYFIEPSGQAGYTAIINYPIEDQKVPVDDRSFLKFILLLKHMVEREDRLYVHCMGGHGRSGLVCACLLKVMGWTSENALAQVKKMHETREYIPYYPCPQNQLQVDYVKNF
jgi:hypothetical protein